MAFFLEYPTSGGGGVTSLNDLTGALTLVAGPGITITPSGANITISATGTTGGTPNTVAYYNGAGDLSSNADFSFNDSSFSMFFGSASSGGVISAPSIGTLVFGTSIGAGSSLSSDQNGSLIHGLVSNGAVIQAGSAAGGSSAWGTADGAGSIIYASAFASTAFGQATNGAEINTEGAGVGALAFGAANVTGSEISASGAGALSHGAAEDGFAITASGDGSYAGGIATEVAHEASGVGSFSQGDGHTNNSYLASSFGRFSQIENSGGGTGAWNAGDTLFAIGNGADSSNLANAFEVRKNGRSFFQSDASPVPGNSAGLGQAGNPWTYLVAGSIRASDFSTVLNVAARVLSDGTQPTFDFSVLGTLRAIDSDIVISNATSAKALQFNDDNDAGFAAFKAPSAFSSNTTYILPVADGTSGQFLSTNGSGVLSWASASAGANTALSNLSATSINQNLIPNASDTLSMGSASNLWSSLSVDSTAGFGLRMYKGITEGGQARSNITTPSGITVTTGIIGLHGSVISLTSNNDATNNSTATPDVLIESGNKTAGTGNSGSISLQPGTSAGGAKGSIKLNADLINGNFGVFATFNAAADPTTVTAAKGYIYFNTTTNKLKVFTGTVWETITSV